MQDPFDQFDDPPSPTVTPDQRRRLWTRRDIRALAIVILVAGSAWAGRLAFRPAAIPDPPEPYPPRFNELADRIDPDTADVGALAVLPGIGPAKAQSIDRFRTARRAQDPGSRVFRTADDLTQVHGIGDTIAGNLLPYLYFPDPPRQAAEIP